MVSVLMAMPAFAGAWKTGTGSNQNMWWYDNEDGTYAAGGWQWNDGNQDGTAECYYFDSQGWMAAGTETPDGYQVNEDGAWTENGRGADKAGGCADGRSRGGKHLQPRRVFFPEQGQPEGPRRRLAG